MAQKMSCLFTMIFTQKGVTQHMEPLKQDGISETAAAAAVLRDKWVWQLPPPPPPSRPRWVPVPPGDRPIAVTVPSLGCRSPPIPPLAAFKHQCYWNEGYSTTVG